jgi:hypothetical protein
MYARAVDEAAARLDSLKHEQCADLALAAVALALAVTAAAFHPALALPLFLGGLFVGGSGTRALWRRWDLLDRLSGERDAYVISEVREHAMTETTMERRHEFAELIRYRLHEQEPEHQARLAPVAAKLDALALDLDDDGLELEPACAVACARLLTDFAGSPLLDSWLSAEDLLSTVHQIRAGFERR